MGSLNKNKYKFSIIIYQIFMLKYHDKDILETVVELGMLNTWYAYQLNQPVPGAALATEGVAG